MSLSQQGDRQRLSFRSHRFAGQRSLRFLPLIGLLLALITYIPVRLAIAHYQAPTPQAILTLGGRPAREHFTA
ncbi:MAG TPA: hypothetical protein V6C65_31765, partial [Allocoleopsis sp.]